MKERTDFKIGQRAFDFVKKLDGSMVQKCKKLGISKNVVYQWRYGTSSPSANHLKKLVVAGADANYILTGIE